MNAACTVETRMHGARGSPCLLISGAVKRLIAIVDYALRSVTSIPVRHSWRSRIVQCVKAGEENDATGLKAALLTRECAARTWRGSLTWRTAAAVVGRCWALLRRVVTGGLALLLNYRAGALLAAKWGGIHARLIGRRFMGVVKSRI